MKTTINAAIFLTALTVTAAVLYFLSKFGLYSVPYFMAAVTSHPNIFKALLFLSMTLNIIVFLRRRKKVEKTI